MNRSIFAALWAISHALGLLAYHVKRQSYQSAAVVEEIDAALAAVEDTISRAEGE